MEAINFTQAHDDGEATRDLDKAQVILVGVSRCGKTPDVALSRAAVRHPRANFPLTPDDFADRRLPASVLPHRAKLFGLTIQPERLREIRESADPGASTLARELPHGSARGRSDDDARKDRDARYDDEVDRGNFHHHTSSGETPSSRLVGVP
jgi:hypothetical protein